MPTRDFSHDEYLRAFHFNEANPEGSVRALALQRALDIRKFEIDLYWKRASYFWTFIGATLAGFVAIQASVSSNKTDLSVLLTSLGFVFSFGWLCVNRGSKHWQENWENHVDMLEDSVNGPLYKVVLSRASPKGATEWAVHLLTGPSPFSVSKLNQLISVFVTLVWGGLLIYALPPFRFASDVNWYYVALLVLSGLACIAFLSIGRTYRGGYWHRASIRTSSIRNDAENAS